MSGFSLCDPGEIRTHDPMIKSHEVKSLSGINFAGFRAFQ